MEHQFSIAKKGYLISEVDRYIEKLEFDLQEYKSKESAISKSIIHSEMTAQQIISDANKEAEIIKDKAEKQLMELQKKIKHMRMKLDTFQSSYNQLMHKYIITMNSNDFNDLYHSLDQINDTLTLKERKPCEHETNNIIEMTYDKVTPDF